MEHSEVDSIKVTEALSGPAKTYALSPSSHGIKGLGDKVPSSLPSLYSTESDVCAPAPGSHKRKVFC